MALSMKIDIIFTSRLRIRIEKMHVSKNRNIMVNQGQINYFVSVIL